MYRKIGTSFVFEGKRYLVVEDNNTICVESDNPCDFVVEGCVTCPIFLYKIAGECEGVDRRDGKNVKFKLIEG